MTLQDKLLTLDERITAQFQKITDWGYKKLGWDKYDWAKEKLSLQQPIPKEVKVQI